jgi:hypothetical protein
MYNPLTNELEPLKNAIERLGTDEVQRLVDSREVKIGTISELKAHKLRNGTKNQRKKYRQLLRDGKI